MANKMRLPERHPERDTGLSVEIDGEIAESAGIDVKATGSASGQKVTDQVRRLYGPAGAIRGRQEARP